MAVSVVRLQPDHRFRLLPPGVIPLALEHMLKDRGPEIMRKPGENRTETLLRLAGPLLKLPEDSYLAWHFLDDVSCFWLAGGSAEDIDVAKIRSAFNLPSFSGGGGLYAGEEGGLAMLEDLDCERGMVCDLGQTMF